MNKSIIVFFIYSSFCLLCLCGCVIEKDSKNTNIENVYTLDKINIDTYDNFVGMVCEKEREPLAGDYMGLKVDQVKVIKGQNVKKGDIICTFDGEDIKNRINYLKKILAGDLWGITDAEDTMYSTDYLHFETDNQIKMEIDKLQNIEQTPYIVADCEGTILCLNVVAGDKITNSVVAEIGRGMQVVIYVSDEQQSEYKTGMNARIFLESQYTDYIDGTVTKVGNFKLEEGYPVYIDFMTADLYLNSKVGIQLITEFRENVYAVPYSYLFQDEKGYYIINEEKGKIYVELGLITDYYVEIVASPLCQGDRIIMSNE